MSKFDRKKIAVTLAFASLFGSKTSAMNLNKNQVKSPQTRDMNKQIRESTGGVPICAKCFIGLLIGCGVLAIEEIIRRNVAKNESKLKGKELEASLEQSLGGLSKWGDSEKLNQEYAKLPPEFRNNWESGDDSHKVDIFAEDNKRLRLEKQKELKLINEQRELYLKELETTKQQNVKKIAGCMGEQFLEKLTGFYNKGIQSFSTQVTTNLIFQGHNFLSNRDLDNKQLSNVWDDVFGFFCKRIPIEIKNIKKINDNTLRVNVPGLILNNERFIEIKLVESGLQLSIYTDAVRIVVEFKLTKKLKN